MHTGDNNEIQDDKIRTCTLGWNITLPKFLTQIRLSSTWISKTTFLKLNDDMFRCIQTTSSGQ